MTDNVIPLHGITVVPHMTTEAAESEPVTDIDPDKAQMYLSLANSANFLLDNKDRVAYFVLGVALKPDTPAPPNFAIPFHVHTSPITPGDFALSLRLLDNALMAGLDN